MTKSENIISFLNPLRINSSIISFEELKPILEKVPSYTILPFDFFESAIKHLPKYESLAEGDWVEIGVWKGGGALFFKALMEDMGVKKKLHLFDTFGKIPIHNLKQGKDVTFINELEISNFNLAINDYKSEVEYLFNKFNLNNNVFFYVCDINNLQPDIVPKSISFLHLDVDFYEPTLSALNLFYDDILPGGIIIIDDYYLEMVNCREAVDDFFKNKKIDLFTHSTKFSSYSILITKPK